MGGGGPLASVALEAGRVAQLWCGGCPVSCSRCWSGQDQPSHGKSIWQISTCRADRSDFRPIDKGRPGHGGLDQQVLEAWGYT